MNIVIKEKINNLLHSDIVNYLETSERLILKNILETDIITKTDTTNLEQILRKYRKFIKN